MSDEAESDPKPRKGSRRTAARVLAVQALYQIDMSGADPAEVIKEFRRHRVEGGKDAPDAKLFAGIVAGGGTRQAEIDALLRPALAEGWALERLDAVMRSLLRAAIAELMEQTETPARVILNEYIQVAHSFFPAKETGFINGVLDRLARQLRPAEIGPDAKAPPEGKSGGKRQTER
jgi:transcription antitermination protein NusB